MPTRFFFDTEFLAASTPGHASYHLISIGIAAEDGRELYLENADFDWSDPRVSPWLSENVRPHLDGPGAAVSVPAQQMAGTITSFVGSAPDPQFWAYNGASDWVVLMSLFGDMLNRPAGWPSAFRDLKHYFEALGVAKADLPPHDGPEHHALADALWDRTCFMAAASL
ncbi:3'-5' exoribonuclease domain-containing protein [Miltoncostaea oceani]|uniref:3'-5' exoribonuclease domain-containing protein n=1 Tax=Miltoncostaea oceani TaxID=2843216 RepID=UPI001C3CF1E1|nr:3'-5' exoribonuclease [Miltoncostaea oceani]